LLLRATLHRRLLGLRLLRVLLVLREPAFEHLCLGLLDLTSGRISSGESQSIIGDVTSHDVFQFRLVPSSIRERADQVIQSLVVVAVCVAVDCRLAHRLSKLVLIWVRREWSLV